MSLKDRLAHAWNAFTNQERSNSQDYGMSYGRRPDRTRSTVTNERSIITAIYARIAIDVASVSIRHVRLDDQDRFKEIISSGLDSCLNVEANIDQTGRHLRQDMAMSLLDKGSIAIVPVETTINPKLSGSWDIKNVRVGEIVEWMPQHVKANVYNEATGRRETLPLPKRVAAVVENPLYAVMNEPNSTLQRLIRKLALLDAVDEQSASGKLDLIIQLPYAIKSETRRQQAQQRRADIEFQLKGSQYGIAYTDATEKITQLNRPAENNLLTQIEFLTASLYGQLGITPEVMNGTADEQTMLNYHNRTVEPILSALTDGMARTFLTKTARSQKQTLMFFPNQFRLVPINVLAEVADKFARNEILTSNEIRQLVGFKPSTDPKADKLQNSNMPAPSGPAPTDPNNQEGDSQNDSSTQA